ncbi:hypothetical protein PS15p_207238 [Mucor circinelloides]
MIYEQNPTKLSDSDSESCDTVSCNNDTDNEEFYDSEECQAGEEEEAEEEYDAYYDAEQYVEEDEEEEDEDKSDEEEEVQVGSSSCGWCPMIDEDIDMEDVPYIDVEMLDADEGVEMLLVEDKDVEMEEAANMMDVDGELW